MTNGISSGTVEVQCSDLTGPALDWSVAKVEGIEVSWRYGRELVKVCDGGGIKLIESIRSIYSPSTNWAQGGPLVSKYQLDLTFEREGLMYAYQCQDDGLPIIVTEDTFGSYGSTHLIAACRAIVAARLGEVVSVPAELVENK
jgi:hypothetical protein